MTDSTDDPDDATESADHAASDASDREGAASAAAVERRAAELAAAGRPFARVTVVRREPPVSANVGDRAVVTPDGALTGWIGGAACAQSIVVREARAAIADGEPRLLGLAPDPSTVDRPGLESYPMTCHSGGTLELFVDPVVPTPELVVVGDTPIARALVDLTAGLDYRVTLVTDDPGDADVGGTRPGDGVEAGEATVHRRLAAAEATADDLAGAAFVVVASQGDADERALEAALRADVPFVSLVASRRRGAELAERVAARLDRDPDPVASRIKHPAGVDVGAETPEEIAVSVLAELIAVRRGKTDSVDAVVSGDVGGTVAAGRGGDIARGDVGHADTGQGDTGHSGHADAAEAADADGGDGDVAIDPICGMEVVKDEAAATVERDGETYYFCGQGCADAFEGQAQET